MPEVGDGGHAESALAALDEELVPPQLGEDGAEVTKMIRPSLAVYQNVVKKHKNKAAKEGSEYIIH